MLGRSQVRASGRGLDEVVGAHRVLARSLPKVIGSLLGAYQEEKSLPSFGVMPRDEVFTLRPLEKRPRGKQLPFTGVIVLLSIRRRRSCRPQHRSQSQALWSEPEGRSLHLESLGEALSPFTTALS
ncbi:hypothetical protein BHE74_00057731 [Ensete ventricosum]|nr:hypothetical protein GW17_00056598 [Ensete ventricosum]RWW37196.1 hypothetical protein BHE74_00057731 [Ensete ventricosum]